MLHNTKAYLVNYF